MPRQTSVVDSYQQHAYTGKIALAIG